MRREGTEAKGERAKERKKEGRRQIEVMGTKDRERGVGGVMMKREEKKTEGETAKELETERRKK